MKTVTRWVEEGHIPGQIIDGEVYVHDSFATAEPPANRRPLTARAGASA